MRPPLLSLVKDIQQRGERDSAAVGRLLAQFESTNEPMVKALGEQGEARRRMEAAHVRLLSVLTDVVMRYERALVSATPAVRAELRFQEDFDAEAYTRLVTDASETMRRRFDETMQRLYAKHGTGPGAEEQ